MSTGSRAIKPPEMDGADETRKRNTDCVYFLASPLTCRKGSECEYRHSDSARLNPTDCCYWLGGGCLNPICAFRHPPLEGFTETTPNSAKLRRPTPALTNKSNTPCYFYFNAYCIKGDHCPFMHDPSSSSQKVQKQASNGPIMEDPQTKYSTGSDTGPASVEVQASTRQGTSEVTKRFHPKEVPLPLASANVLEEPSSSAESSMPDFEEQPANVKLVDKLVPVMRHLNRGSNDLQDQNSEELLEGCLERGDWCESSSGFDVLVYDGSEQQIYEDETEYLLAQDREHKQHSQLFRSESEGPAGYDPSYPDIGYYDHNVYNSCDRLNSRSMSDYCHRDPEQSRMIKRTSERLHQRKRREMSDRDCVDLRDHLRRRRMSLHQPSWRSTRHHSSLNRHSSRECHVKCLPNGRLASEIGKSMIDSPFLDNPRLARHEQLGYSQRGRHARASIRERGSRRRRTNPYAASTVKYARLSTQVASDFTGPKSLAQIREQSRTKLQMSQCHARIASHEFEGPKPLTELLKHKNRLFQ